MQNLSSNKIKETSFDKSNWAEALALWDRYTSPFIPSKEDEENYTRVFRLSKQKKNILVLGATPQIREILSQSNAHVIVVDFSFQMIQGMLRFGQQISIDKEDWIKADWMILNDFLKNEYFDVIAGDLVLRNIDPQYQLRFLRKISKLLKNNGCFVSRFHYFNESNTNKVIETTFDECHDTEDKSLEDLIASRLFDKNTDFSTNTVSKRSVINDIEKYVKKGVKNKREELILKNVLEKWTAPRDQIQRTWTQRTKKTLEQLLSKNFTLHNIKTASDYKDAEFYPIYTLKLKNQ